MKRRVSCGTRWGGTPSLASSESTRVKCPDECKEEDLKPGELHRCLFQKTDNKTEVDTRRLASFLQGVGVTHNTPQTLFPIPGSPVRIAPTLWNIEAVVTSLKESRELYTRM